MEEYFRTLWEYDALTEIGLTALSMVAIAVLLIPMLGLQEWTAGVRVLLNGRERSFVYFGEIVDVEHYNIDVVNLGTFMENFARNRFRLVSVILTDDDDSRARRLCETNTVDVVQTSFLWLSGTTQSITCDDWSTVGP